MKKFALTIIVCVFGVLALNAQYNGSIDILKKASQAFCIGDTQGTIKYLEQYKAEYGNSAYACRVLFLLSRFYQGAGEKEKAFELLNEAFEKFGKQACESHQDTCGLFRDSDCFIMLSDICIDLSKLNLERQNYRGAFMYLNLTDVEYNPMKGCGNGFMMHRTMLSVHFADYYLATGDTTAAIDRLLDFFMSGESGEEEAGLKLKEILVRRYTKAEIAKEIDKGINDLWIVPEKHDSDQYSILHFRLFGHIIEKYRGGGKIDVAQTKEFYRKNAHLKMLME